MRARTRLPSFWKEGLGVVEKIEQYKTICFVLLGIVFSMVRNYFFQDKTSCFVGYDDFTSKENRGGSSTSEATLSMTE